MTLTKVDRINIAIDGPAGAGKSTVARQVAAQLGYVYVDTGAMYRAVTLLAQRKGIEPSQSEALRALVRDIDLQLIPTAAGQMIMLHNEDVTEQLRSREVTAQVSHYASNEHVRTKLGEMQRQLAEQKGIVMDGRDIGTHVLPDAELKVFLTASVEERARRRHRELTESNYVPLKQLEEEIAARDKLDETREIAPLIQAGDAILLDSSHMSIEEVVAYIVKLSQSKLMEVSQ